MKYDFKLYNEIEPILNILRTNKQPFKVLWQWIKEDKITYKQFEYLMYYIIDKQ